MAEPASRTQILLARLAGFLMLACIIFGIAWYGVSLKVLNRVWQDIVNRPGGPMTFRFILQPVMAAIAALHDGIKDARIGRPAYSLALLTDRTARTDRLWEGLISTARIILLGLAMDAIYQIIVLETFYPAEAVIIALLLAFIPYLLLRGPIGRIARRWFAHSRAARIT